MTQTDEAPEPGRWQEPDIVTTGDKTFRVVMRLKPEVALSDRQIAYGLVAVLVGETVAEVRRLGQWQDQKADDFEAFMAARGTA